MDPLRQLNQWLDSSLNRERTGDFVGIRLDNYRNFIAFLPPPPAPCIVGGTKGKGSTVRLLEAALLAHGVSTIAFTSPHVRVVTERWRLNGLPVDPVVLLSLIPTITVAEQASGMELTYFERTAALAIVLASTVEKCQLLWEVGLGGRLDCANALDCAVAVLTHVSHDHRDILGPTLWHIAAEKLPISRPGRQLVIAPQSSAGEAAIRCQLPEHVPVTWVRRSPVPLRLALLGDHQQDNASTVLAVMQFLLPAAQEVRCRQAMTEVALAARCQLIHHGQRRILVDGAHNGPSVAATIAVAQRQLRPGWKLLIGLASDKEIEEIAASVPGDLVLHRCGYDSPRSRGQQDWPSSWLNTPWYPSIQVALAALSYGDLCITGSLYVAGEALSIIDATGSLPG